MSTLAPAAPGKAITGAGGAGRIAAGAAAVLLVMLLAPLAVLLDGQQQAGTAHGVAPPGSGIPAVYVPIYQAAAEQWKVNWYLLASIHRQESDHTRSTLPGISSGLNAYGCCAGPMQFNLTDGPPSTWARHRDAYTQISQKRPGSYPQKRTPHPSVYDDFDAIAAAADKLSAQGATTSLHSPGTYRATCAYIGSCSNVANCGGPNDYCQVLPRARQWHQEGAAAIDALPGGPGAGSALGDGTFFPVPKDSPITGRFAEQRPGHRHAGVDFAAPSGTAIVAIAAGRVTLAQATASSGGYGNYACVDHGAYESCSAHMLDGSPRVSLGQHVRAGQQIGRVGNTGNSFGAHLHFEIRRPGHGTPLCPAPYLDLPADTCVRSST